MEASPEVPAIPACWSLSATSPSGGGQALDDEGAESYCGGHCEDGEDRSAAWGNGCASAGQVCVAPTQPRASTRRCLLVRPRAFGQPLTDLLAHSVLDFVPRADYSNATEQRTSCVSEDLTMDPLRRERVGWQPGEIEFHAKGGAGQWEQAPEVSAGHCEICSMALEPRPELRKQVLSEGPQLGFIVAGGGVSHVRTPASGCCLKGPASAQFMRGRGAWQRCGFAPAEYGRRAPRQRHSSRGSRER
jgi:hypothetical protein